MTKLPYACLRAGLSTLALLAVAACSAERDTGSLPGTGVPGGTNPGSNNPGGTSGTTARELIVHEWGTYTSLQSSEGKTMIGLHHAEELLPAFVHSRANNPDHKGVERLSDPVTQKLETPVLYFYGKPGTIEVEVGFPAGLISEWFPSASSFSPAIADTSPLARGSMRWSIEMSLPGRDSYPFVPEDSVWAPSRRVAANTVRAGREQERFIFYRGLGSFERPVQVESYTGHGEVFLIVRNQATEQLPAVFVLRAGEEGGAVIPLGALEANTWQSATVGYVTLLPIAEYVAEAQRQLQSALEATGLYADEARAMVDTWSHSYFQTPGVRVLYIAPRAWADELLPITIDPQPKELVRTLVGRIEVMTPPEEGTIVRHIMDAYHGRRTIAHDEYGRFSEPKYRRAIELISDEAVRAFAQTLIDRAAAMP